MNETSSSSPLRQDGRLMTDRARVEGDAAQAVVMAKQYIDENFCEPIHLDDLAAHVGMTRFSLSKRFRQRYGVSPYRYVCQVRVRQAQTMMEQGLRPTDIASETGFFDQSHLARHFKRLCGMTPRQYRTRCIQSVGQ
ncbi:helix-turn-helix transcriptional regulator [Halomonas sp. ML-15]|uniref:helix-turn-helix domain-containing protein n=1 Tax=Halomonas sp. ML-15 TaxID=2773305 RepID=UPI001745F448|nr:AraC family transcriptional regulator [Halomonas sp. ML-15]MBD3897749.1 helix-turn-helix transcriptional regulator [Halomonas sp. ML-15]